MACKFWSEEDVNDYADYEAEAAIDADWDEFILEQEAGAWCDAERKAECALDFGYGG